MRAVCALCNRLERHAAAFVLGILKTNAAGWRLHSVLDSVLWERCGNAVGSSTAPWARCGRAAYTLYRRRVNPAFRVAFCNAF